MNANLGQGVRALLVEFDQESKELSQTVQDSVANYRQSNDDAAERFGSI